MKQFSVMSAAATAAFMIPQAALSQTEVEVPPDGLRVRPTVRLLYDNNILRQNDDLVTGEQDDLRITPSVDVTYRRRFGLHQLTVIGSAGYDFHQRFEFLDRERISLQADGDLSVAGYCHVYPRARLNFAQSNLSDQGVIDGNTQKRRIIASPSIARSPMVSFPWLPSAILTPATALHDAACSISIRPRRWRASAIPWPAWAKSA